MTKPIFTLLVSAALLASCGSPTLRKGVADSLEKLSVSDPVGPVKKNVADSIYNGEVVERYSNGVIYKKGMVQGGVAHGVWQTFYNTGKPWSEGLYKNGLREGHGTSWWPNGQKSSEGEYKAGKMVGKWMFADEQGNVVSKDFGDK